jgi:hypothetical protein
MHILRRVPFYSFFHALLWTGAVAFAAWSPLTVRAAEPGQEVIGKWKLVAVLDATHIASMDEKEAKTLLGHVFSIRKEGAEFEKEVCGKPDFETQRVVPSLYLERADPYVTASSLSLPNPVTVVDIGCTSVFIKNRNKLVIFWNGFYFDAVRLKK